METPKDEIETLFNEYWQEKLVNVDPLDTEAQEIQDYITKTALAAFIDGFIAHEVITNKALKEFFQFKTSH